MSTKVMICAGEASGDLHGTSVAEALRQTDSAIEVFGMGGAGMRAAGVDIVYDIAELGMFGFVEVVWNIPRFFRLRDYLSRIMDERRPDVVVLIDYGGFNMFMAAVAKRKSIPVVYYICPKAWVWGRWRAKKIAKTVAQVAAIFPFEADIYRQAGANVTFVGHPLVDIVRPSMDEASAYLHFNVDPTRPLLLLLPGSRRQEVDSLLDVMLASAKRIEIEMPDCQFYLPVAPTISYQDVEAKINASGVPVTLTRNGTYDLMQIADCAIAASGTVTLEAALMGLPSIIIYRVKPFTFWMIKKLATVSHIGLPNIIAGRRVFPELLQDDVEPERISQEAVQLMQNPQRRKQACEDLQEVQEKLGEPGAVKRVVQIILQVARRSTL